MNTGTIPRAYYTINQAAELLNMKPRLLRHVAYMLNLIEYRRGKKQKLTASQLNRLKASIVKPQDIAARQQNITITQSL